MADITNKDRLDVLPLADQRIDNVLNVLAGSLPKDADERNFALFALEHTLGVDLDEALDEYIRYQKSNPLSKKIKDIGVKAALTFGKDKYISELNNRVDKILKNEGPFAAQNPDTYNVKLVNGLKNILNQPQLVDQIVNKFMDYRNLATPLPFVQSNVNYTGVVPK